MAGTHFMSFGTLVTPKSGPIPQGLTHRQVEERLALHNFKRYQWKSGNRKQLLLLLVEKEATLLFFHGSSRKQRQIAKWYLPWFHDMPSSDLLQITKVINSREITNFNTVWSHERAVFWWALEVVLSIDRAIVFTCSRSKTQQKGGLPVSQGEGGYKCRPHMQEKLDHTGINSGAKYPLVHRPPHPPKLRH